MRKKFSFIRNIPRKIGKLGEFSRATLHFFLKGIEKSFLFKIPPLKPRKLPYFRPFSLKDLFFDLRKEEKIKIKEKDTLVFDIDGVLFPYPEVFLKFLEEKTGIKFKSVLEASDKLKENFKFWKEEYRKSPLKEIIEPEKETIILFEILKKKKINILFKTERPESSWNKTKRWIKNFFGIENPIILKPDEINKDFFLVDNDISCFLIREYKGFWVASEKEEKIAKELFHFQPIYKWPIRISRVFELVNYL